MLISYSPLIGAVTSTIDDENSQAEGFSEGAVGFLRSDNQNTIQQQQSQNNFNNNTSANHRHYENIYESLEQYNEAAQGGAVQSVPILAPSAASINSNANASAEEQILPQKHQQQQRQQSPPTIEILPNNNVLQPQFMQQQPQLRLFNNTNNINYRNDLYDRSNIVGSGSCNRQDNSNNINNNNNYDVPRSVRSGLGYRRNFQLDLQTGILTIIILIINFIYDLLIFV